MISIKCNLSSYSVEKTWMKRDQRALARQSNSVRLFSTEPSSAASHELLPNYLAALFVDNNEMSAAG